MRTWIAGALALALTSTAEAQTIKVATFVPEQSVGVSKVIKPWIEAVQAEVGDDVDFQTFWGGTLGKSPFKQYELVKNGVADVTWVLPGYTTGQFPELQIMELPFLAETGMEASIAGWKLHEQGLLTGLDDVHLIGFWATEPNNIFSIEPVTSAEDLAGKKIRSVGPVHAAWAESVGASPQTMSSSEMNEGFNRGALDAAIQGWTGMRTFKTLNLVNAAYQAPIGVIPFLLLMNKATWEGLPANVQEAIMKHGGLAMAEAGGAAYTEVGNQIIADTEAEGRVQITYPSDEALAGYRDAAQATHQWWIDKEPNGKAVYDAMVAAIEEVRASN